MASPHTFVPLPYDLATLAMEEPHSVLLQTGREREDVACRSLLFRRPLRVLQAKTLAEVEPLLLEVQRAVEQGLYAAGYLAYESGFALESKLLESAPMANGDSLLAWFGLYDAPTIFDHTTGELTGPDAALARERLMLADELAAVAIAPQLATAETAYAEHVEQVRRWIAEGECYQLNLTTHLHWQEPRSAAQLFAQLLAAQPVEFGALLQLGDRQILSFSPELFFERDGARITTRPMKGTAPRGRTLAEDDLQADWLAADEKNRAENLMIVDLLRNDLGRVCETGSVVVEELFTIERFATLLQMTSTVSGQLRHDVDLLSLMRALFPSGSITGAPKIRAMQLLRSLEGEPRGVYTGAIGYVAPNERSCFSVVIRTVELQDGSARMGVGSGIIYDSDPQAEYQECLLKGRFLSQRNEPFELIETLLWDGHFPHLALHLARLKNSATYFGWICDLEAVRVELLNAVEGTDRPLRVRLTLNQAGRITIQTSPYVHSTSPIRAVLAPEVMDAQERFLQHKTTRRELYDSRYAWAQELGFAEAIFVNREGELTEGCIHSLFVVKDGRWSTPPTASGALPSVMRAHLLSTRPELAEARLTLEDLRQADAVYLANALRGLRRVAQVKSHTGEVLWTAADESM